VSAVHFASRLLSAPECAHSMSILSLQSCLSGPHGARCQCDVDAVTQQGTREGTERSAFSIASLFLNCTCSRFSLQTIAQSISPLSSGCHAGTMDSTSEFDPDAMAFAYST
jgi:hypothetical protein